MQSLHGVAENIASSSHAIICQKRYLADVAHLENLGRKEDKCLVLVTLSVLNLRIVCAQS